MGIWHILNSNMEFEFAIILQYTSFKWNHQQTSTMYIMLSQQYHVLEHCTCQNPLLGKVLRSRITLHSSKESKEIQIKLNKREETPPRRINSNGQNKSCSKNSCLNSKKSYNSV